ncbi:MAG: excinuclease ABC subunit UvrA [Planctomycetaceae bacterium]
MSRSEIVIRGAREHNLRDVSLSLPKNKLIVMTGVSGSGKSSLAFDTLYAEGQRRYVESLSSYARQFLGQMPKPDVDSITGLAPSISIEQKTAGRNPRSTVGTITEIYDYLRVLFARVGQGYCYVSGKPIRAQSADQIVESIAAPSRGREGEKGRGRDEPSSGKANRSPSPTPPLTQSHPRITILAPLIQNQKGEYRDLFDDLLKQGFLRARVDGEIVDLNNPPNLKRHFKHTIEVVIDRLISGKTGRTRLAEAVESALKLGKGSLIVVTEEGEKRRAGEGATTKSPPLSLSPSPLQSDDGSSARQGSRGATEKFYSANYSCPESGMSYEPPTPQLFSFNSPLGMCPECTGLGMRHEFLVDRLVDDDKKSIAKGCLHLMKPFRQTGRWQRHLYEGAAAAIEEDLALKPGALLKTAWKDLPDEAQRRFLNGTGDRHVTFAWRHRGGIWKHGGTWEGLLPKLLDDYRDTKNPMRRRQLEKYMDFAVCTACGGSRLNKQAQNVRLTTASQRYLARRGKAELSLPDVCRLSIADAAAFFDELVLDDTARLIATEAVKEIRGRLEFLLRCGLDYLALERTAPTLSGGESQRIRLAGQIGCGLVGVVYILDEPSIGLHPRDNTKLLESLQDLRDQGNTVIVVEHDEETMRAADLIVDFGPGPGVRGGEIITVGSVDDVKAHERSVTGQYLNGTRQIAVPGERRKPNGAKLRIRKATHHNLKNIDAQIPLGLFVCVTGVSGSGKSSLVNDILWPVLNRDVNGGLGNPGPHVGIDGLDQLDKAIDIDQSPIGRTPRSNPATYVKVFDHIRDLYTNLPQAKLRGYPPGRFSFNVEGGRCEACEGHGATKLEMDFLADIWVPCPVCESRRFNHETLEVKFKDKSIADVLEMDIQQALEHFENVPKVRRLLQALHDVGLDYLKLGQPSPTLSGGEAQRVKLARELGKRSTGRTIYLLDEPTTGLHFADVHRLLDVLHGFVSAGNTVLVVEHNLDVIKTADWVIDLGPEGGDGGGAVVASGTPEQIAACEKSYTGAALRAVLGVAGRGDGETGRRGDKKKRRGAKTLSPPPPLPPSPFPPPERWQTAARTTNGDGTREITIRGAAQHNLQNVDLDLPRDRISVFCGPSGSGKSSLAMDTLYAEGQRRYVESLSAYARQFLGQMPKPKVEHVHGLSPAIAIEQKTVGSTPRSTVGTVTEIYDYLRLLFARLGTPHCPACETPVGRSTTDEIIEKVLALGSGGRGDGEKGRRKTITPSLLLPVTSSPKALLLAPQTIHKGESYRKLFDRLKTQGFSRVRIDGTTRELVEAPNLDHRESHNIEVVVDRITLDSKQRGRIADSIEAALDLGRGVLRVALADAKHPEEHWEVKRFSLHAACDSCGRSFEPLTPQNFSFNSPLGWCTACEGLGVERGTDQSALIANPHVSLRDGAIAAWPDPNTNPLFAAMLEAIAAEFHLPLDVPFDRLEASQQRLVLYGSDRWITAHVGERGASAPPAFRFQYKGLYPSLNEAARVSYSYRTKLRDFVGEQPCSACEGHRIRDAAAAVRLRDLTLPRLCRLSLGESLKFLDGLKLSKEDTRIAGDLLTEAKSRLKFLADVGLEYLTLDRTMPTLSGGESQRIRLAGQIGRALTGVLYVLDEPTIGLHPRDNNRLLDALKRLRDLGNTVVLVEHDREVIEAADRVYDFGPGSGRFGGSVTAEGTPKQVSKSNDSLTGRYLSGKEAIPIPATRRMPSVQELGDGMWDVAKAIPPHIPHPKSHIPLLSLLGCRHHNLRNIDLRIPLGTFVCVTGVSGSGKSSLIEGTLGRAVARRLHQAGDTPGPFTELRGVEQLSKVITVDQQPLGSTPASNPATYTGVFDLIRELFARMPDAKVRGYKPARFSFNRPGGRCEDCEGLGQKKIEMHFLPDVWVTCDTCRGRRYNTETLAVSFQGKSIADVLEMSIGQAHELFAGIPKIRGPLAVLCAIGLDYLTLGQPAPTLSGGEAQRVKLAAELARPHGGRTLYLLDEPTTGLHFDDIAKLLKVHNSLVDQGNTVVVIEHNLDVIKSADWIIDLGPEAGAGGGWIVAEGTPEDVVAQASGGRQPAEKSRRKMHRRTRGADAPRSPRRSYTSEMLAPILASGSRAERDTFDVASETKAKKGDVDLAKVGRNTKMPWQADGRQWHCVDRISHEGKPCRWEGEALAFVLDEIAKLDGFAEPNFNHKSVVEVLPASKTGGWFLHVHTAHEWWVKFTFRVKKSSFDNATLSDRFPLPTADDLDLPVYGKEPRVEAHNLKLPWQEVNFKVHWKREIDTPEFREFLKEAKAAFFAQSEKARLDPAELTPWKVLGRKWHLSKKGFSSPPVWEVGLLEQLIDLFGDAVPDMTWDWQNKQVVAAKQNGDAAPFAEIYTKRPGGADLVLTTSPGRVPLGRIASLGAEREIAPHRRGEAVRIRFTEASQLDDQTLKALVAELSATPA